MSLSVDRVTEDVVVPGIVDPNQAIGNPAMPRIRKAFPETLLWTPQLITDDDGRAHLDIDLADSITTWRSRPAPSPLMADSAPRNYR